MTAGYSQLSAEERDVIQAMLPDHSIRSIAAALGRSPSTVSRELRRNSWRPSSHAAAYTPYRPARLKTSFWTDRAYVAARAHAQAIDRLAARGRAASMSYPPLLTYVTDRLRAGWSPLLISGRLPLDHPDDHRMRISPETLYQWIYATRKRAATWSQYLARAHRRRRARGSRRAKSSPIKGRVPMSQRPRQAQDRTQAGHWEADSVICTGGVLHTLVDRSTRYLACRIMPDKTAASTLAAQHSILDTLPQGMRRTITYDNGSEFALHHQLVDSHGVLTYFADPYCSWQRGTNENRNGLIRRYLPKGCNITTLTPDELAAIITEINNRPMRTLGYLTPAKAHQQAIN